MLSKVKSCYEKVKRKRPSFQFDAIPVVHYSGGPCDDDKIRCCAVMGGKGKGWTLVTTFTAALLLASQRAGDGTDSISSGSAIKLSGLSARADLNGQLGVALKFDEGTGRWNVRCRDGLGIAAKVSHLRLLSFFLFSVRFGSIRSKSLIKATVPPPSPPSLAASFHFSRLKI